MPVTKPAVMGVDLGTGGARAIVVEARSGEVVASATHEYPLLTPKPQWAEQRPEDWWEGARGAISAAGREGGGRAGELVALGVTGQMHGLTLLNTENRALRPAMLWCDTRTGAQCEAIDDRVGKERLREI